MAPFDREADSLTRKTDKPRIVVLGSGWGAMSMIKALPESTASKYDIVVVSPRNYFLYTPLLPAVATGTMEERSIVEPVRNQILGKGRFFEAMATTIDPENKFVVACFPKDAGLDEKCFKIPYDQLVVSVGSINNTFGVPGVDEHCMYFKSIEDAKRLRARVSELFERAALPNTSTEDLERLLSFVIVGGGPTGVEVAAELHDMVTQDLRVLYPELMPFVKIRIIELMDHVLSTYDRKIAEYATEHFRRTGIECLTNTKVQGVQDDGVKVLLKDGTATTVPFGACVWCTGIKLNPLAQALIEALPKEDQTNFRAILTDNQLRVKGSKSSIFAIGDAATIEQPRAISRVGVLFDQGDADKDGLLSLEELRDVLAKASTEFPHLEEHARFLSDQTNRFAGLVNKALAGYGKKQPANAQNILGSLDPDTKLTRAEFEDLLKKIDNCLRALPATAQVARQQGEYLAEALSRAEVRGGELDISASGPFQYNHKGSLAYVGGDEAVMDIPLVGPIMGAGAGIAWKSFETYSQISFRNQ